MALTFRQAVNAAAPELVDLGGEVYELRPSESYALAELVRLNALLQHERKLARRLEHRDPLWRRMGDVSRLYEHVIGELAELIVRVRPPAKHATELVTRGLAYMDATASGGRGTADIGQTLADLQRVYRGDPARWWTMPLYQLKAFATAKPPGAPGERSVTPEAFMSALGGLDA